MNGDESERPILANYERAASDESEYEADDEAVASERLEAYRAAYESERAAYEAARDAETERVASERTATFTVRFLDERAAIEASERLDAALRRASDALRKASER